MRPSRARRFLRHPLGGVALWSALVALAFFAFYAVPNFLEPRLSDVTTYETDRFAFHYRRDAPVAHRIEQIAADYQADLDAVRQVLGVPASDLPAPVHVFLHPDWARVRAGILARFSAEHTAVYPAVLDALYDQHPHSALVELVTAYGWGPPSSRLLKAGVDLLVGHPEREAAARAAARLGLDFVSLPQLIRLADRGRFAPTLYESFNAPTAKTALDLTLLSRIVRAAAEPDPAQEQLDLEAAAFVSFVRAEAGWSGVRRLWTARAFSDELAALFGRTPAELDPSWRAFLEREGRARETYPLWRGVALAEHGRRREAEAVLGPTLAGRDEEGASATEALSAARLAWARLALEAGRWAQAREALAHTQGAATAALRRLLNVVDDYRTLEQPHLRLHADPTLPPDAAAETLHRAQDAWAAMRDRLALGSEALPDRLVLYLHADGEARARALGDAPPFEPARGVGHLRAGDAPEPLVADAMVAAIDPPTNSTFLTAGLADVLVDGSGVRTRARALLERREWVPLRRLSFDGAQQETARTEAAALVDHLLRRDGLTRFLRLWSLSSPLEENWSLFTAVEQVYGQSLSALEAALVASLERASD